MTRKIGHSFLGSRKVVRWAKECIPFFLRRYLSYHDMMCWRLGYPESILDVGCGRGEPIEYIRKHSRRRIVTVGIDIWSPHISHCKRGGTHDAYVFCDVRKIPFRERVFDAVLCLEVLEHLLKRDGMNTVKSLEKITRRRLVVSVPNGLLETGISTYSWGIHISSWSTSDFVRMNYKVSGAKGIKIPLRSLTLTYFTQILAYIFPVIADHLVCVKDVVSNYQDRSERSMQRNVRRTIIIKHSKGTSSQQLD